MSVVQDHDPANSKQRVLPDGAHLRRPSWLDGFRRITSSGEFIPEIDGLRFIAIAAVIIRHVAVLTAHHTGVSEGWLRYGRHGVELFFVISGFILAMPFAMQGIRDSRRVSLKRYFLRRVTRLEPPYLLSLLIYFALKLRFQPGVASWRDLLLSTFYSAGITRGHQPFVSTVDWSLEVEVQFYLLMPLLALVFRSSNRLLRRGCIIAAAMGLMLHAPIGFRGLATGAVYDYTLLNYLQYFLMGLLLADIYATEWSGKPPPLRGGTFALADLVWLVGWPLLVCVYAMEDRVTRALAPALIFVLYLSLFYSIWARRIMRWQWITIIGGMCYSIYLMHNFMLEGILKAMSRWLPHGFWPVFWIYGIVSIPLLLVGCAIYFRLIERPCMRPDWPKRAYQWLIGRVRPLPTKQQTEATASPGA